VDTDGSLALMLICCRTWCSNRWDKMSGSRRASYTHGIWVGRLVGALLGIELALWKNLKARTQVADTAYIPWFADVMCFNIFPGTRVSLPSNLYYQEQSSLRHS
jgi:hypothetical protein